MSRLVNRTGAFCAFSAATLMMLSAQALAQEPKVVITAAVRDFERWHPDFNVTSAPAGHVAGNIALAAPDDQPVFVGGGYMVNTQWTDRLSNNIAPHLYRTPQSLGELLLGSPPNYNPANATIDSWSSSLGSYGGANVGPAPAIQCPAPMPVLTAPTGLPPYPGKTGVNQNVNLPAGNYVFGSSFQCRALGVGSDSVITVAQNTDLVIYTTGNVSPGQNTIIVVPPTSTLKWYFSGDFRVDQGVVINMLDPMVPSRCQLYNLDKGRIQFCRQGSVCAQIFSPEGPVYFQNGDQLFGNLVAESLEMANGAALHWDGMAGENVCGNPLQDRRGAMGVYSNGAITSVASFSDWFMDKLGVNLSATCEISLTDNGGVFEYLDDGFYPVDDRLFGNEGEAHNYNFTMTFSMQFVHEQCGGKFFQFSGSDDAWMYINGQLVMDLGGVRALTPQFVDMDRLGLADGSTYTLYFYYAQRHAGISQFNLRTNLDLFGQKPVQISTPFD